jgi:energy-coupling factor transporter ATP-binding protein EcfA2
MKKIIMATGARGVGKSTFLAGIVPATKEEWEKVFIFDTEDSWNDLVEKQGNAYKVKDLKYKIGRYVRAYDRLKVDKDLLILIAQGKLPWVSDQQQNALIDYYQWFMDTMAKELSGSQFKYVFVDTIEPVEAGLSAWVEKNRSKAGWSGNKTFGRFETEGVRPLYENIIEGIGQLGVEYIGLTSHLKQPWIDNKPVLNKIEPGGRLKLLTRIAYLMLWLVHGNNEDGAPAALVMKSRMSVLHEKDGRLAPRRVLPERIPHASWSDIENYIRHPANFLQPSEGETMTDSDRQMISEMLNDEQMRLMILDREIDARQAANMGAITVESEPVALPKLPKLPGIIP